MNKVLYINRCQCGAVTLTFANGAVNSMYQETFDTLQLDLTDAQELPKWCNCDHCVNHWGIDLCSCGSGERVGECECGSNEPHDYLGAQFDSLSAIAKGFRL